MMGKIVGTVRRSATPGEHIRIGDLVTYVARWHGAVGYIDLVVATDGRRYAVRETPPAADGARRWVTVRRYEPRPACGQGVLVGLGDG